ncbi:hypothetical protein AB1Y20_002705 [Prymnesium parvum]|uniref:Uncharacterized protein n=1 Tax=Prymnesium parvum TaxID=97485 RepID=A0AB34JBD1_PRYPA
MLAIRQVRMELEFEAFRQREQLTAEVKRLEAECERLRSSEAKRLSDAESAGRVGLEEAVAGAADALEQVDRVRVRAMISPIKRLANDEGEGQYCLGGGGRAEGGEVGLAVCEPKLAEPGALEDRWKEIRPVVRLDDEWGRPRGMEMEPAGPAEWKEEETGLGDTGEKAIMEQRGLGESWDRARVEQRALRENWEEERMEEGGLGDFWLEARRVEQRGAGESWEEARMEHRSLEEREEEATRMEQRGRGENWGIATVLEPAGLGETWEEGIVQQRGLGESWEDGRRVEQRGLGLGESWEGAKELDQGSVWQRWEEARVVEHKSFEQRLNERVLQVEGKVEAMRDEGRLADPMRVDGVGMEGWATVRERAGDLPLCGIEAEDSLAWDEQRWEALRTDPSPSSPPLVTDDDSSAPLTQRLGSLLQSHVTASVAFHPQPAQPAAPHSPPRPHTPPPRPHTPPHTPPPPHLPPRPDDAPVPAALPDCRMLSHLDWSDAAAAPSEGSGVFSTASSASGTRGYAELLDEYILRTKRTQPSSKSAAARRLAAPRDGASG